MTSGKGLQLERDTSLPVQAHFDALTQKATLGFVLIAILTFAFISKIDLLLEAIMSHLNPCDDLSCLTLYEPASWSVVRWLTAVFLSILLILPFVLHSMYAFARPGLTQSEKNMLKRWMVASAILGYVSLFILFYFLIPLLYLFGDGIHQQIGLSSQYDAVSLFTFALSIFWAILITYIIAFATVTAGSLGLITDNNQDWWRTRVLGIGGVILLLSLPGRWNGTNIVLLSLMIMFLEFSIRKSVRASKEVMSPKALFDHEGRRRFVTYVDCSCQGVSFPIDTSPENTGLLKYEALCDNIDEREHLIDTIARYRLTDVIIGGCNSSPLPSNFKKSVESVNCRLRGLNFLEMQGATPSNNEQLRDEIQIHLENVTDPWTSSQRIDACSNRMKDSSVHKFIPVESSIWPEMQDGVLRISVKNWTDDELATFRAMQP
ncbi:MAG: twin-arginine translocase subunit TatC [Candidatus Poseidoniaceae archaeon]|nr:twin-arginine translocase subunit TatC [Candidatus Poseidoniaceae archaeon]